MQCIWERTGSCSVSCPRVVLDILSYYNGCPASRSCDVKFHHAVLSWCGILKLQNLRHCFADPASGWVDELASGDLSCLKTLEGVFAVAHVRVIGLLSFGTKTTDRMCSASLDRDRLLHAVMHQPSFLIGLDP
jgi:hypothetical protein